MREENSLQKFLGVSTQFLKPLSPENTYETILQEAGRVFGTDSGSIFLRHNKKWQRAYSTVPESAQAIPRSQGISYRVFKTQKPIIMKVSDFLKNHPEAKKTQASSLLIIPLSYNNESLGVIALRTKKEKKLTKHLQEMLQMFGSLATLSIKKTQLYEETKDTVRMRDLFISLAAHELRTPLTTINAYVQLLYRKLRDANFSHFDWVQELSVETTLVIRLVNELLNVDLIQHGVFSYQMKPISLLNLVTRSIQQFTLAYPFYGICIETDIKHKDMIMGDADKLLQMMSSLLQNAAKFSSPDKGLVVRIQETATSYSLFIVDHGIGIPHKDVENVFKGFYKGSNNYKDGMGLGLYLSKRIIEKHNGTITTITRKNKGTTIKVELPKRVI